MRVKDWVVCKKGVGHKHDGGVVSGRKRHFESDSVGLAQEIKDAFVTVWLIGTGDVWDVPGTDIVGVDVKSTGDKFSPKICNVCHRLLPIDQFFRNQNNLHGVVRRPSCFKRRTDIDKRAPKTRQAKNMEKKRPKKAINLNVLYVSAGQLPGLLPRLWRTITTIPGIFATLYAIVAIPGWDALRMGRTIFITP